MTVEERDDDVPTLTDAVIGLLALVGLVTLARVGRRLLTRWTR